MEITVSYGAEQVLKTLENAGFKAYIVGGAVRDSIMGITPSDYDIATNAKPYQVKALFPRTIDTGLKHGTVTVVENKTGFEVTTFRTDGEYNDMRRDFAFGGDFFRLRQGGGAGDEIAVGAHADGERRRFGAGSGVRGQRAREI